MFGTPGHRGLGWDRRLNEGQVLAIAPAIHHGRKALTLTLTLTLMRGYVPDIRDGTTTTPFDR